jgi:uncharacterized membrane protein
MFAILVVVFMIVSENKHFVQPPQFPGFGGIFPDILPYVCTQVALRGQSYSLLQRLGAIAVSIPRVRYLHSGI